MVARVLGQLLCLVHFGIFVCFINGILILDTVEDFDSLALTLLLLGRFALPLHRSEWLKADIRLVGAALTFLIVFQIKVIREDLQELLGLRLLIHGHVHVQVFVHFLLHF